jgi:SAM-dependent methyltransferase
MDGYRSDTYGDAFADVYDQWYRDVSDPAATARFVDRRGGAGPVLELGVGSGRLARPLAALGRPVVGVDASGAMLARCRATGRPDQGSPVVLARADMADLPLRGPFGAVLCAFNTLFNLASLEAQRRALAEARRVLAPDGVVVIEAITGEELDAGPRSSVGVTRMATDELVLSATLLDREAQLISGQHVQITGSGVRLRPWLLRWITPSQLDAVAGEVGLALSERLADWEGTPFERGADRHVSVYRAQR